jgi:hypothetical protein
MEIQDVEIKDLEFKDIEKEGKFVNVGIGDSLTLAIKKIQQIKVTNQESDEYDRCLSGTDYYYKIITQEDKEFTISSWALWAKVRELIKKSGKTDISLSINHVGHGKYEVKISE